MKRLLVVMALLAGATTAFAQGFRFGFGRSAGEPEISNPPYDGRFTFARLKFTSGPGGYYYYGLPAWAHGYVSRGGGARAEQNLMRIMKDISLLTPHDEETAVVAVDDPELCRYPVAFMTEAGYWTLTESEAAAFRAYLQKGGFVIFDDFRAPPRGGGGWENFAANMQRVLPGAELVPLEPSHPIFHAFFDITSFDIVPQSYDGGKPSFVGVFENNDPQKRLMAMINYNTDVSDFWEFSATGFRPVEESNQAYKLGVNYVIYGLTH